MLYIPYTSNERENMVVTCTSATVNKQSKQVYSYTMGVGLYSATDA